MGLTFLTPLWRSIRMDFGRYGRFLAVATGMWLAWSGNHTPALGVPTSDYRVDGAAAQGSGEFLDGSAIEMLVGGAKTPAAESVDGSRGSPVATGTEPFNRMLEEWDTPAAEEPLSWSDPDEAAPDQDSGVPDADYLDLVDDPAARQNPGGASE
ncbi:MAG TPA: hypothetical protein PLP29_15510 [Candidatus Ozemobacteraceae bacterium]|nr:hypothetical protein [Candidatus Ozemobacteraceae bacterium]